MGLVAGWIFFYLLGEILIQIPIGIRSQFRTSESANPVPLSNFA
jgi:hypothetical protein